jgi:prefoldin subunit 4
MSADEVDVTREDQQRINEFSRLNNRKIDLKSSVEKLQKEVQDLDDASEGVLMAEGAPGDVK